MNIKHGDMSRHISLVHERQATLIDFEMARKYGFQDVLKQEFSSLPAHLTRETERGGLPVLTDWPDAESE